MWMIAACKNGISSYEIHRALGITQKTAWFLLHRVRLAMQNGSLEMMSGPVECDETFIGGLEKNKHHDKKQRKGRGGIGKQIVMGILERGAEGGSSRMRAKVVPNTHGETLKGEVKASVTPGASVFTDAHGGYRGLSADLEHQWVDHAVRYVEGQVHTNGCENFWSLFSRMLGGTYTHIDPRHLQSYVDEQVHRFNNRHTNDAGRFADVLGSVSGKRLTYRTLTGRGLAPIPDGKASRS